MALFASVVESNGFSGAARRLGLTRSALSRQVSVLEKALGVRLLNRTTRRIRLTEAGEAYYESCARVVAEAERAERAVSHLHGEATGTLRVSGPVVGAGLLLPLVKRFMARHPQLSVDLALEDHYVNLVAEGLDVAIRIGHPADSTLVARKLMRVRQTVCGSPLYFAERGLPGRPDDLVRHEWILYSLLPAPDRLEFTRPDGYRRTVRVGGRLKLNGGPAIRAALLQDLGVTMIPDFYVSDDLAAGRLQEVLSDYDSRPSAMYAVYPHRDHLSTKVRLFVDFLAESLSPVR